MCLKDPNRFYLGANETIWILFFNLNLKLAEKTMWGKFQKALQKSPWFMERGTVTGRTNLVYQPNKDIRLGIGSTEEHALSVAVQYVAIDEMSFGENDNVEYQQAGMMQIYNQLYLRLSSRFSAGGRIQGRMYLISSAKSTNAVLESFIRDNEGQPGMHVSRYKQWEVLPASKFSGKWFKLAVGNELLTSYIMGTDVTDEQVKEAEKQGYEVIDVPLETLHRFEMDLNRTLIDTCGISVQSSYKYIPYRIVEPCIGTGSNPFKSEIIKTGLKDDLQIADFFIPELVPEILYTKKLYVHCDLSKSGDRTGISCVAVLGYKNQERYDDTGNQTLLKEMVFRHVFSVGLQCPANDELSMIKVKDFIHYLKYDLGWNIVGVSCDGYQSLMLLQSLKLDGFNTKEISMDIVKNKEDIGYTTFRNVLVEQRIKLLNLHELLKEITNLEKNESTGKVDHPKQCLVGDTKIRMLDGGYKTINELVLDQNNCIKNYVYTFNEKTKTIEPKLIKNVWQTGYRKDLYKITLDNNESIICTSNHPFMLRNGKYLEASKLQIGQSLMPLYTKISDKGLKGYRMYYEPMEDKWHYEHTKFDMQRKYNTVKGNVTHHANYNKLDNKPTNLKYISKSKHTLIHNRNQSIDERQKRSITIKNWHRNNRDTIQYTLRAHKTSESVKSYYNNLSAEKIVKNKNRHIEAYNNLPEDIKSKMTRKDEILYTNGKIRKYFKATDIIPEDFYIPITKTKIMHRKSNLSRIDKKLKYQINKILKQKHKQLASLDKRLITAKNKIMTKINEQDVKDNKLKQKEILKLYKSLKKVAYCKINNKKYNELTTSELFKGGTLFRNMLRPELKTKGTKKMNEYKWYTNGEKSIYISPSTEVPEGFFSGRKIKNHKIIKIEKLNYYEKVYDLEIEDNHNFALDCGVFVHNSIKVVNGETIKSVGKDISDSLGGAVYNAVLSVDINELDYMEGVTLTNSNLPSVSSSLNQADSYFGFINNNDGSISFIEDNKKDVEQEISDTIEQTIQQTQNILTKIKQDNPNTKLSNQELKDMYSDFNDGGFLIF